MSRPITVQQRVAELVKEYGSYRNAAYVLRMDHAHLYRIGIGKTIPRPSALVRLGLCAKSAVYARL